MKISTLLGIVVVGTTVLLIGGLLLKDITEKNAAQIDQELNEWVERLLSESLSNKLDASPSFILQTLKNGDNYELIQEIQQSLKSVNLIFQKKSSLTDVEVVLKVLYQDGTFLSAQSERNWDDLPSTIRKEFLQTNEKSITVPWDLPLIKTQLT